MGAHLIDGEFQSDKYPTCPRGKVPLSTKDTAAQPHLWEYAHDHRGIDSEFSDDLQAALRSKGYVPPTHRPSRLDAEHTACGETIGPDTHLRLGDGETCEWCTHVVAQVAAALRGEPSWAQKA